VASPEAPVESEAGEPTPRTQSLVVLALLLVVLGAVGGALFELFG